LRVQEIFQKQQKCSHYTGTAKVVNFPKLTGLIGCCSCAEILDQMEKVLPDFSWHTFISALEHGNYTNSNFHRANTVELICKVPW